MLEQAYEWFQNGGTALVTGATALVGGIAALTKTVGTFNTLKESLPTTVQDRIDASMVDVTSKIEAIKTTSDQFKLQETIINAKAKLESSVISAETKQEYLLLAQQAQEQLRTVYGIVIEVPLTVDSENI